VLHSSRRVSRVAEAMAAGRAFRPWATQVASLLVAGVWFGGGGCGGTTAQNRNAECSDCGSGGASDAGFAGSAGQAMEAQAGADAPGGAASGAGGGAITEPLPDGMGCPGLPYDGIPEAPNCVGAAYSCESLPSPDMLILLERSAAMAEPWGEGLRWAAASNAIAQFIGDLPATGPRVGIQLFGATDDADELTTCDPSQYVRPAVGISEPADAADLIAAELHGTGLAGASPTWPALIGSLQYAMEWEPPENRFTQVVLVVAGMPAECAGEASLDEAVATVQAAQNADPAVVTYVVGLDPEFDLDPIALAAGSLPIRIGVDDAPQRVLEALSRITAGLALQWTVTHGFNLWSGPPTDGRAVDLMSGVVTAEIPWGERELIPQVDSSEACASSAHGGWYYDDPAQPTLVDLCPCTRVRVGCPLDIEARWACEPETLQE